MGTTVSQAELEAGRGYETLFVPALFAPWTKHLIEGAGVAEGAHVLDVGCGSGALARQALLRTGTNGRVVGVDPAPGMLAAAKEMEPGIEWVRGSAEALDFGDGAFDCVASQFGMMFFQDRTKAAAEMARVTRPDGRLAVAVWNSIDNNPAYGAVIDLLDREVGRPAGDALRLPYCLGDPADVTSPLEQAGLTAIAVETRSEQARFADARTMVEAELRGWLPLFDIHLDEDRIADVLGKSGKALDCFVGQSGNITFPTSAHIVTARKRP